MLHHHYSPPTPEQDAQILRKGLRNALIALAVGAGAYIIATVLTFWR